MAGFGLSSAGCTCCAVIHNGASANATNADAINRSKRLVAELYQQLILCKKIADSPLVESSHFSPDFKRTAQRESKARERVTSKAGGSRRMYYRLWGSDSIRDASPEFTWS
jgi:hypothetical protein